MNNETEKMLTDAIINLGLSMENLRKDIKEQLAKVNAGLGEMRLSYMKMADETSALHSEMKGLRSEMNGLRSDFNKYAKSNNALVNNHETRIVHLEEKPSGNSYVVSEPAPHYTRGERSRTKRKKRK